MPEVGIELEGDLKLQRVLDEIGSLRPVKKGLGKGAVHLKGKIAEYPDEPMPSNPLYKYIRGTGTLYVPTGRIQETSEKHSASWAIRSQQGGLTWLVGSDTTYGKYLQDHFFQTMVHKTTGWETTKTVTDEEAEPVNQIVMMEIDAALAKVGR